MPQASLGDLVVPAGGDDGLVHGFSFPFPNFAQRVVERLFIKLFKKLFYSFFDVYRLN